MTEKMKNVPAVALAYSLVQLEQEKDKKKGKQRRTWWLYSRLVVVPEELHSIEKLKMYVTIQEHKEVDKAIRLPAEPLMFIGNIWKWKFSFIVLLFGSCSFLLIKFLTEDYQE